MKRLVVAVVLSFACASWAEITVGGEFALEYSDLARSHIVNGNREANGNENHFRFALVPSLIFPLSDVWELNPRLGVSYEQDNNNNGLFGFVLACGLFYHVIDRDPFTLSLGPDVIAMGPLAFNNDLLDYTINVGMPVNGDIHFGERVFLRLGFRMVEVYFNIIARNTADDEREREVGVNLLTLASPFFGFYVTF